MSLDDAIGKLRQLNEPVPKPMRLPTPEEVAQAERDVGVAFHPDFRKYLLSASDVVFGTLEPVTITRPECHDDLRRVCTLAWDKYGVPRSLLPICHFNGDFYCMDAAGHVVYWSHNGWDSTTYRDLAEWIEEVWMDEG